MIEILFVCCNEKEFQCEISIEIHFVFFIEIQFKKKFQSELLLIEISLFFY